MGLARFIAGRNGSESNFEMSYEALSTYIREENGVFLQVCCAEERDVGNRECVGELIVNIGGLRRHLLATVSGRVGAIQAMCDMHSSQHFALRLVHPV